MGRRYSLRTLGSLGVDVTDETGETRVALASGKPAALLTYLMLAPGRSVLRDELVDLLWANVDVERARLSLRQALFQLRSTLGTTAILTQGRRIVLVDDLAFDLLEFRELAEHERADAIDHYSGSFLDGISFPGSAAFEHWADGERARAESMLLRCAERCVSEALEDGRSEDALRLTRRTRDFLPHEQEVWRLVIETALATGDRALATVEGELLTKWMVDEAIEPSARVARTLRQLQRAEVEGSTRAPEYECEFVGRDADLAALLKAYHATVRGHPRHVHVVAQAGLGKSRLLAEFGARCRLMRGRVVSIAALPSDRTLPFALQARVVAVLGMLTGASSIAPASAAALVRLAPTLSSRFDVDSRTATATDTELTRTQVFRELVESVAAERTLVLLVDDLHWSDIESLAALRRVAEHPPSNLLVVTSTRPPIAVGGTYSSSTRELVPLGEAHVRDMLVTLGLSVSRESSASVVRAITDAAGGSPLHVLQLVRQGLEDGWIRRDGEGLDGAFDVSHLPMLDPIGDRLRDLPATDARLLLALARGGGPLDDETLGAVVSANVGDALQRLATRGLVTATPVGWMCAHDVIADQFLRRCAPEDIRGICVAIGRTCSRAATSLQEARVAARFLADGGDLHSLRNLLEQQVRRQRAAGRDIGATFAAQELIGGALPNEQLRSLASALPITLRFRRRTQRLAAAIAVVAAATTGISAMRPHETTLTVVQRPLASTQSLVDSSLLELRPSLIVEPHDNKGRTVRSSTDTIDVTLRDSITGVTRITSRPLRDGRATFDLVRGANLRVRTAVIRRRGSKDSLFAIVNWRAEGQIRLRFVSFKTGGVEVSPRQPTLRLPPAVEVSGVLRVDYTSHLVNETLVYAWTPTWGDPAKEARRFGMLSTPTDWRPRDDPLTFRAPSIPGEYFIILLGGAEEGEQFLLSGTNWVMKEPRWRDGNEVARWPRETLMRLTMGREVAVESRIVRLTHGLESIYTDRHYPAAFRLVVDAKARAVSSE